MQGPEEDDEVSSSVSSETSSEPPKQMVATMPDHPQTVQAQPTEEVAKEENPIEVNSEDDKVPVITLKDSWCQTDSLETANAAVMAKPPTPPPVTDS